jgi:hypothetical protein
MEGGADQTIQTFRELLNSFKRPFIENLEEYKPRTKSDDDDPLTEDELQQNERILEVLSKLDLLYLILYAAIQNLGVNTRKDIESVSVCKLFEKNGIFEKLRREPSLKDKMLHYLQLDLKVYPFTLNTKLINSFTKHGIETHQRDYVAN